MSDNISRRIFLGGALATAAQAADTGAKTLPTRVLGRTKETPSILALGCGSRLLSYKVEDRALEAIQTALDNGIRYLDTAQAYGNGQSETWVGKMMPQHRKNVFLATKTPVRKADDAMRNFEMALKRLQTDHVDVLHIHNLQGDEDLAQIEAKDGVLQTLYKLREQKMARFIGITSHTNPVTLRKALERHDFDCTQMALNAALQGMQDGAGKMKLNPSMATSFEKEALPAAKKKNLGVIAMKVYGQEELLGQGDPASVVEKLLRYSLSLPVAVAVVGMPKLEYIPHNTQMARAFKPMSPTEMKEFSAHMAATYKAALDRKFANHIDA
jgi:predicted aldo/keto reductase-like oxidoreductase